MTLAAAQPLGDGRRQDVEQEPLGLRLGFVHLARRGDVRAVDVDEAELGDEDRQQLEDQVAGRRSSGLARSSRRRRCRRAGSSGSGSPTRRPSASTIGALASLA